MVCTDCTGVLCLYNYNLQQGYMSIFTPAMTVAPGMG